MSAIGRIVLELNPGPGNPRNSEGSFYTAAEGRILFAYSRFTGDSGSDDAPSCIACRESADGGETWSDDRVLFTAAEHGARNVMSVSLLAMQNGDIGLFYLIRQGWHDTRLHLRRSGDGGRTWSDASLCIPARGYYVTNNDRVIRLACGRILAPGNLHRMKGDDNIDWKSLDSRAIPFVFYSDDDGHTWQECRNYPCVTLPHSRTGLQESGLIERRDGSVYQWMRTDMGRQYESVSADRGESWSAPVPSRFTAPPSPLSMRRVPGTGQLAAVWNPIPNYNGRALMRAGWGRTPLVLATSADDGQSWSEPAVLEDAADSGYCYTAIGFTQDAMLLAYCAGGEAEGGCLNRTVIRKIPLEALAQV